MKEKGGGWASDYLALRGEMLSSIEKQDQLFIVLLTAFGAIVALAGANDVSGIAACVLWLALMFVILVIQSKTLQYRDTVYRIGSYLFTKEGDEDFSGYLWEREFNAFNKEQERLTNKETFLSRIYNVSGRIKNASFFGLALLAFLFLAFNAAGVDPWQLGLLMVLVGIVPLALSALFFHCIQKDGWKYASYSRKWASALEKAEGKLHETTA